MQITFIIASIAAVAAALPALTPRAPFDAALVPPFGITPGQDPVNGSCRGYNGVRIPCNCPPDRNTFLTKFRSEVDRNALPFPLDNSAASKKTRVRSGITVLQNLQGPGLGCPVTSTNWASLL